MFPQRPAVYLILQLGCEVQPIKIGEDTWFPSNQATAPGEDIHGGSQRPSGPMFSIFISQIMGHRPLDFFMSLLAPSTATSNQQIIFNSDNVISASNKH
jgi:hypothetical protein